MREDISEYILEVLGSVVIGKGVFTHPVITLMKVEHNHEVFYKLIEHTHKVMPTRRELVLKTCGVGEGYIWKDIDNDKALILYEALDSWDEYKNNSLMSYSYIYAYCKALRLDLHKDLLML